MCGPNYRLITKINLTAWRRVFGAIPGSLQPDEEQRQELGWAFPIGGQG